MNRFMIYLLLASSLLVSRAEAQDVASITSEQAPKRDFLMGRALKGTTIGQVSEDTGITLGGYVEGSGSGSSKDEDFNTRQWNDRRNGGRLNNISLSLYRALSADSNDIGGRIQFNYGTDPIVYAGGGFLYNGPRGHQPANHREVYDLQQYYLEGQFFAGSEIRLHIQAGRFACPFGIETLNVVDSTFQMISRSVAWGAFPYTSHGAIASVRISKAINLRAGCVTLDQVRLDQDNLFTYAGFEFKPTDDIAIYGNVAYRHNLEVWNLNGTWAISQFTLGFDTQFGRTTGESRYFVGATGYVKFDFTDEWSAIARAEWFKDPSGNRTGSDGEYEGAAICVVYRPIFDLGDGYLYNGLSFKAEYKHIRNLVDRRTIEDNVFQGGIVAEF